MHKKKKSKSSGNKYILIVVLIIVLDQITKYFVKSNVHQPISLIKNFLSLTFVTNTGSAFGILQGTNSLLIFMYLIILGAILFYWDTIEQKEKIFLALIVGGAFGNLIDRIFLGHVIDFISFSFWPAFNVADSAITIGVLGLMYKEFRK